MTAKSHAKAQRIGGLGEIAAALLLLLAGLWQWHAGVYQGRTPVKLPNGAEQWLTIYDGPHVITAFVLAAAAILVLVDGVVRLRR